MVEIFVIGTHAACPNILQTGVVVRRKEEEEQEQTSQTSQKNHLMLVNLILACSELCLFFAVKLGYRTRCQL